MFMSVIDNSATSARYGELAGARVMITGVAPSHGVDIARAFADHKARLVLQTASSADPETTALIAVLAESAHEIKVFDDALDTEARFAQTGTQTYGSVDAVINVIPVAPAELAKLESLEDIEDFVSDKLSAALVVTTIAANRMRLMLTEGLILNVIVMGDRASGSAALVSDILRTELASMTRKLAETWAGSGRPAAALASEPEMAAVALYLASKRARGLSGHIFDAEGSLTKCG
jgi:NAD(P)-dependent dehydrogenase (short-subunit alcohol dehydrogenase family)